MRILHISPFYPPHVGGLQSHAQGFDQHMAASGVTITTFTPRLPRIAKAEEHHQNLSIYRYPAVHLIPNYPLPALWHPTFWRQLHRAQPRQHDVIISRTRFFLPTLAAVLLAKILRKPYVHIEHGSDFVSLAYPFMRFLARCYDLTLGRFVLRSATAVVANSAASAQFVKNLSGRDAAVIYRGIDKETIARTPPHTQITNHQSLITIVYIGRLIDGKGVDDLIRATHILSTNHKSLITNLKVFIIGLGPYKRALDNLVAKYKLANHILFLGERSFCETIAILKSSDIAVNPSHTEGLPTSVIEAALCKRAIIATNVGGTPEIITDGVSGYLIPPKQPELLAEKINLLLRDPSLRQRLGEAAFQEVSQKFSWQKTTRLYQQILDKL